MTLHVFVATEEVDAIKPILMSLAETQESYELAGLPQLQSWFDERGLGTFQSRSPLQQLQVWNELSSNVRHWLEGDDRWVVFLGNTEQKAQQSEIAAMSAYLVQRHWSNVLVFSDVSQYTLWGPDLLDDSELFSRMSLQLLQQMYPTNGCVTLRQQWSNYPSYNLYTTNPLWEKALEVLHSPTLNQETWANVRMGSEQLVLLSQSEQLDRVKGLLIRHGRVVGMAAHPAKLAWVGKQLIQNYPFDVVGAVCVVSEPMETDFLKQLLSLNVPAIVAPLFTEEQVSLLKQSNTAAVVIHSHRVQLGMLSLKPMSARTVEIAPMMWLDWTGQNGQVTWLNKKMPAAELLADAELAYLLSESVPEASVTLVREQQLVSMSSANGSVLQAIRLAVSEAVGEAQQAVCVIRGNGFSAHALQAIIQERFSAVILIGSHQLLPDDVAVLPMPMAVVKPTHVLNTAVGVN